MNKLVLVKYAPEIFLKGLNRNKFEKKLKNNITKKLKDVEHQIVLDQGRWFIKSNDLDEIVDRVRRVFGVQEVSIVTEIEGTLDNIKEEALRRVKESNAKTFKIETNRANKNFH